MNYRGSESQEQLPHCCFPGCDAVEPGVGETTCVVWGGKRLCYAVHFPAFAAHPLSDTCSDRGKGPTDAEWQLFIRALGAKEAA